MSLKNKIISGIKSSIYDRLLSKNHSNKKHVKAFEEKLIAIDIGESLKDKLVKNYITNIDSFTMGGKDEDKDAAENAMYLTVYSYCESVISEKILNWKKIILFGESGVGKTAFACSYLKQNGITSCYYSGSDESIKLVKDNVNGLKIEIYNDFDEQVKDHVIIELSTISSVIKMIKKEPNSKILLLIDSQASFESLCSLKEDLENANGCRIEGIIITKKDFTQSLTALMSAPHILKTNILAMTTNEITDKKRSICSPYDILEIVANLLFNKKEDIESIRDLLTKNVDMLNLKTYRVYISFMLTMDATKYEKIFKMFDFAFQKFNVNSSIYKNILEKIKNDQQNVALTTSLKKHLVIIDSMRDCEKTDPSIIDIKRAKRISKGSGLSVNEVFSMISKFEQTKKTLKFMNYSKLFDGG